MENLTLEQLLKLAQQSQDPSISIYLPTHRAGGYNRTRSASKTWCEAEQQLQERAWARDAADFLHAARSCWRIQAIGDINTMGWPCSWPPMTSRLSPAVWRGGDADGGKLLLR